MNKRTIAMMLALSILVCGGCSEKNEDEADARPQANDRQNAAVSDSVKQNAVKIVKGTVQSITGNEITLLISSESESLSGNKSENISGEKLPRVEMSERSRSAQEENPQQAESIAFSEKENPHINQTAQGSEAADAAQQPAPVHEAELTEHQYIPAQSPEQEMSAEQKTAVFLLPVGMSMGSKDFSSVTAGNTLTIYFGIHPDNGSEIITGVEVGGRR